MRITIEIPDEEIKECLKAKIVNEIISQNSSGYGSRFQKEYKEIVKEQTGEKVQETAESTRKQFYTQFGWEGKNYDCNRSLKEVAQVVQAVRAYIKEKYPAYKFSVRTSYASMCQEILVELKESPIPIYKTFEELTSEDFMEIGRRLSYKEEEQMRFLNADAEEKKRIIEKSTNAYKNILNAITKEVIADVDAFVKSYNYHFDVDFYYVGCCHENGRNVKIVPKITRTKEKTEEIMPIAEEDSLSTEEERE